MPPTLSYNISFNEISLKNLPYINVILGGAVFLLGLFLIFGSHTINKRDKVIVSILTIHSFFELCIAFSVKTLDYSNAFYTQYLLSYPLAVLLLLFISNRNIYKYLVAYLLVTLINSFLFTGTLSATSTSPFTKYSSFLYFITSLCLSYKAIKNYKRSSYHNYILLLVSWLIIADQVTIMGLNGIMVFDLEVWDRYFVYYLLYIDFVRIIFISFYGRRVFKKSLVNPN